MDDEGVGMATTSGARSLQKAIANMRGVRGAVVEQDPRGRTTIRVLVVPERKASEVRAQVLARAEEMLGEDLELDDVTVLGAENGGDAALGRRVLSSLTTERGKSGFKAKVTLALNGDLLIGEAEGAPGTEDPEVVAAAVIGALNGLLEGEASVESVEEVAIGDTTLGVVTVTYRDEHLAGSALLKHDSYEMVARATLQALNRPITKGR